VSHHAQTQLAFLYKVLTVGYFIARKCPLPAAVGDMKVPLLERLASLWER
jgi:hypothetical protein